MALWIPDWKNPKQERPIIGWTPYNESNNSDKTVNLAIKGRKSEHFWVNDGIFQILQGLLTKPLIRDSMMRQETARGERLGNIDVELMNEILENINFLN